MSNLRPTRVIHAAATRHLGPVSASLSLAGCAAIPDVTATHQPVNWSIGVSVIHTITCTRDSKRALVAQSATFTPGYKANTTADPIELRVKI